MKNQKRIELNLILDYPVRWSILDYPVRWSILNYPVRWSKYKVLRDFIQNFMIQLDWKIGIMKKSQAYLKRARLILKRARLMKKRQAYLKRARLILKRARLI